MRLLILSLIFLITCSFNSPEELLGPKPDTIWIKMNIPGHDHFYMSHPSCGELIHIKHLPECICGAVNREVFDEVFKAMLKKHPEYIMNDP